MAAHTSLQPGSRRSEWEERLPALPVFTAVDTAIIVWLSKLHSGSKLPNAFEEGRKRVGKFAHLRGCAIKCAPER